MENWDLTAIFKTEEDWKKEKEEIEKRVDELAQYQGKLTSALAIKNSYEKQEEILKSFEKVYAYAMLSYHQDMSCGDSKERYQEVEALNALLNVKLAFLEPELVQIPEETLRKYIQEEAGLQPFKRSLEKILEQKKHVLSKEKETLLSEYTEIFSAAENTYDVLCDVDFKFPSIQNEKGETLEVTHEKYGLYMKSPNRNIRKQAFSSIYSTYKDFSHTITELYLTKVKQRHISTKLRHYSSSLEAAVEHDEATIKVYENLVKVVKERLGLHHQYLEIKKKLLGVEEFHLYDMYTNPITIEEKEISFTESKEMVLAALQPMGKKYLQRIEKAFQEGWIDVYEKPNKRTGGYSLGVYDVHPYILLNYQGTLRDTSTLIHELGHAMHSCYAAENQNVFNADYTIMTAEVASTVNEILLSEYLIAKETDSRKKAELLLEELENIRATLIRQTMFAEFEKKIHDKIALGENWTSEKIEDCYYQLNQEYFGKDVVVDSEIRYEWARIPHFYTCFYVYKYATGISAAIAIASKILAGEEGFVEKYQEMLKQGGLQKSVDLLKMVGVDLETTQPYEDAFDFWERKCKELEELV